MKWNALRSLDMYARAEEHLTTQTLSGALVSLAGLSLMVILFIAELMHFLSPHTVHHLQVCWGCRLCRERIVIQGPCLSLDPE